MPVPTRLLGSNGPRVSALGLGCMEMAGDHGPAGDAESIATIHAALDGGVTLIETSDSYGMGRSELLLRDALRDRVREDFLLSVSFGVMRGPDGAVGGIDGRPAAVKNFLAYSLRRLGTDYIDIYRPARVDPRVPIEETVGAIGEMVEAGYVGHVGLSEVGAATLRRAQSVHPIADLQIEYSPISRDIEDEILPACRELGVGLTVYGTVDRDLPVVEGLREIAETKGATVGQLATAWVLSRGEDIVPLIGARTRARLAEALGAFEIELSDEDLGAIERTVPALSAPPLPSGARA